MNLSRIVAVLLIVAGVAALVYGGFSYPTETHAAAIGALEFQLQERKHVDVPPWMGIASIAIGTLLLAFGRHRTS